MYSNSKCRIHQKPCYYLPRNLHQLQEWTSQNFFWKSSKYHSFKKCSKNTYLFKSVSYRLVTEVTKEVRHMQTKCSTYIESAEKSNQRFPNCSPYYICSYYKQVLQKFTQLQLSLQFVSCLQIIWFFSNSTEVFQWSQRAHWHQHELEQILNENRQPKQLDNFPSPESRDFAITIVKIHVHHTKTNKQRW